MAAKWSSEHFVAEYKEMQANAMAVDCVGRWALLGGRRALALVNLQTPKEDFIKIARHSSQAKWDINCMQFNPHACKADAFVTASNQRLEVLQLANGNTEHRCNLKAHTRTVSDVDWSPFDVNQLASCSVDTYTYLWDIRDPKKPAAAFQSVAGASQVKWNKVVNNMFATTHDGDIRVWDPRKGSSPIQYIAAHLSKIHGLDWNPHNQYKLVTASQDCFVRFWDCTNHRRSEYTLDTGSPVWRARLTPFGQGLMTVVVPQLRRGENKLYLWNTNDLTRPVHTFIGHKDVVLEFHWRKQPEGVRDQQLITWSRDQSLRIWRIDSALQELCGHDTNDLPHLSESLQVPLLESLEPSSSSLSVIEESPDIPEQAFLTSSPMEMGSNQPQTLQQEFSLVNKNIPNVTIDDMDAINRICHVTAQIGKRTVSLNLNFPANYPNGEAPTFQFLNTTLDSNMQKQLIKVLTETCRKHVKRNMNCLEPCLRQLSAELDSLTKTERKTPDLDLPFPLTQQQNLMQSTPIYPLYNIASFQDSSVPFPRTSGARFCSVGILVIFGRPADIKKVAGGTEPTPKALSDLAAFAKPPQSAGAFAALFPRSPPTPSSEGLSISDFYTYKEKKHRTRSRSRAREVTETRTREPEKATKKHTKVGPIKIYDVSACLTVNKQLAENYKIDLKDVGGMCSHNAAAASAVGRKDLIQVWNYLSVMLPASQEPCPISSDTPPFAATAFGRPLLKTMIDHYSKLYDVQTMALLSSLFWNREETEKSTTRSISKSSVEYMPANTDANITYLGSSTDSGWSLLQSHAHSQLPAAPRGPAGPRHLAPGAGPLSEVASHPNLAALFQQAVLKNKRSNSWSESCDDYRILDDQDPVEKAALQEQEQHENNCKMLEPSMSWQYDLFKKAYANILYCWGLHNEAAHIRKFISTPPPPHKGIEFSVKCTRCLREVRGPQCVSCKHLVLECIICHNGVRGAANFCIACSHGGHTKHMAAWFSSESECPTGCGCLCLKTSQELML